VASGLLGVSRQGVSVDLHVNALTLQRNEDLLATCCSIEPQARPLALLVRRWAKNRGLSSTAHGHLPPYAWSLLTIFFLQAAGKRQCALPPLREVLEGSDAESGSATPVATSDRVEHVALQAARNSPRVSLGCLFSELLCFYSREFDWGAEVASVLLGQRSGLKGQEAACSLPHVEDPFTRQNLGAGVTAEAYGHLRKELLRAGTLCDSGAPLSELMETSVRRSSVPVVVPCEPCVQVAV